MRGRAKSCVKIARNRVEKAWQYQYRDRRNKKRPRRALWITRINAATREHGVKYVVDNALARENVCVDRKILAELAVPNALGKPTENPTAEVYARARRVEHRL